VAFKTLKHYAFFQCCLLHDMPMLQAASPQPKSSLDEIAKAATEVKHLLVLWIKLIS
jgi:hypothetical protein